jgi:peptide/nickel transport system permease protein
VSDGTAPAPPGRGQQQDETPEPSREVAIDLSRRKDTAHRGSGRASIAGREALRKSLVGAGHVAAPYMAETRSLLARLGADRLSRIGALVLACLAIVAVFGDFVASDLPVVCRWKGTVYVLPNVMHPATLAGVDSEQMQARGAPGDWSLEPLVAHGPMSAGADAKPLLAPLSPGHPLGTDATGRDVLARVVFGARTALGVGFAASVVLVLLGVVLGALAGFAGGVVDGLVSRAVESLTAIPTLVLVLVVGAVLPHPTTSTLLWTIALTRWAELARLVRAEVLLALGQDYVVAARALGASAPRLLAKHVLPNVVAPATVAASFGVASVVLTEAAVDFLRVGSPDGLASWGEAMGEARAHPEAWWLTVFPGAALLATLVALNLIGEAARDAMDPRLLGRDVPGK